MLEVTVPKPAQQTPRKVQISVGGSAAGEQPQAIEGSETAEATPTGSTEAHACHLPYGTDTWRVEAHAARAVRLIAAWGFASLGLERIDLFAATGNRPSQLVAERCGFTREAVLRSYFRGKDGYYDMVAYGLLSTDPGASYASANEA